MKITKHMLKKLVKEEIMRELGPAEGLAVEAIDLSPEKIQALRKLACTKYGRRALVKLANQILDDPGNIESHIGPLARLVGIPAGELAEEIKKQPVPDLGLPMQPETVGQGLKLLGGFLGGPLRAAIGPMIPGFIEQACDLSQPLPVEEGKRVTKHMLKKLIKEELQKIRRRVRGIKGV